MAQGAWCIISITESGTTRRVMFVQGCPGKPSLWLATWFIYLYFLLQVPETKDLVIDPQLMKPLDHFTGASFLKVITEWNVVLGLVSIYSNHYFMCWLSESKALGMWPLKSSLYPLNIIQQSINESTIMDLSAHAVTLGLW